MLLPFLSFCIWPLNIALGASEPNITNSDKPKHALQISIEDIKKPEGNILVSVYNSAKALQKADPKGAVANFILPAQGTKQKIDLHIEEGIYAVVVAHDVNGNMRVDKNWLGIPTEPVGVSNKFKSKLRKPTFAECAFRLQYSGQCVPIILESF